MNNSRKTEYKTRAQLAYETDEIMLKVFGQNFCKSLRSWGIQTKNPNEETQYARKLDDEYKDEGIVLLFGRDYSPTIFSRAYQVMGITKDSYYLEHRIN